MRRESGADKVANPADRPPDIKQNKDPDDPGDQQVPPVAHRGRIDLDNIRIHALLAAFGEDALLALGQLYAAKIRIIMAEIIGAKPGIALGHFAEAKRAPGAFKKRAVDFAFFIVLEFALKLGEVGVLAGHLDEDVAAR